MGFILLNKGSKGVHKIRVRNTPSGSFQYDFNRIFIKKVVKMLYSGRSQINVANFGILTVLWVKGNVNHQITGFLFLYFHYLSISMGFYYKIYIFKTAGPNLTKLCLNTIFGRLLFRKKYKLKKFSFENGGQ